MGTNIRAKVAESNPWYLSKHAYLMARHFALQYTEWRQQRTDIERRVRYGLNVGGGRNESISSPVEDAALAAEGYSVRMALIERAAKIAGEDIWEFVLLGVTTECSYEYLRMVKGIPCGKDAYYRMYRKFFWLLNRDICSLLNGDTLQNKGGARHDPEDDRNVGRAGSENSGGS